ncbi:helix-turn-helix domain-containing protein [Paenibacillus larvae]|uniref:HTH cro/C1-type domain-containing protein n=1 Tax=Paenibacillus larvae subsp. larvae DSM 25430 TaxID=697284 RepID=V9W4W8_9BACL|nr:helix-turn-helix transcriptional regulator [Paenibacillus larvae]AHD04680.1 hypothetical protein ERIC2_c08470 [Paenibacillus larvae subsp. larvae DSM 25430]MDR5566986.1 helix-turn-helix transcriptional regulator [Paenibacillus larvae]MDR5595018.1 helix-turn-helix transcriptional regulator [Paenibacillus larvae]
MILERTKLYEVRNKAKLTQLEVAVKLGIKLRQYQYIEKGTRRPSYEILCKLEDLFQMSHRELFARSR